MLLFGATLSQSMKHIVSIQHIIFIMLQAGGAEFSVTIVACGPMDGGTNWVYAVNVIQPVQSWTVVRSHDDFRSLGTALLAAGIAAASPCPLLPTDSAAAAADINTAVHIRNEVQGWLSSTLMNPSVHESPAVSTFLTAGANTFPPQYGGVAWTQFSPVLPSSAQAPGNLIAPESSSNDAGNVYDMEMDDMFIADDENEPVQQDDQDEDEDFIPAASVRYKPTDEAITDEDEMEIMQSAGEVEMIDDIGSLAQSLGASHLGRSLRLQAEMKHPTQFGAMTKSQQGLNIGGSGAPPAPAMGGIGGAMAQAANLTHFNHKPPVSAPKLDSFKMIKVIGKGSFGMLVFGIEF